MAAWDGPEHNPWATIPTRVLVELGHIPPPDPSAPGMFTLATPGHLDDLIGGAGFTEVTVDAVDFEARHDSVDAYFEETADLSRAFGDAVAGLSSADRDQVRAKLAEYAAPFAGPEGALRLPARSLVAAASA
jgi:hypothetical protein